MPSKAGIIDTAAYRVIRQIVNHGWGADVDIDEDDIVAVCRTFQKSAGSWEAVMAGNIDEFIKLENSVEFWLKYRESDDIQKMAIRIAYLGKVEGG